MAAAPAPPASLNPAQLDAVHHLDSPCLVLAGAGSGKTRVITHKVARLLQAGYAPSQIAAITFTNKAAAEMRERTRALIGPRAAKHLVVSTFHSLGVRILREEGERIGLKKQFSIFDSDDVLSQLRRVQAIITHLEPFPAERAQAACRRAEHYASYSYGALKTILRRGLDLEPLPEEPASPSLPLPRFARPASQWRH